MLAAADHSFDRSGRGTLTRKRPPSTVHAVARRDLRRSRLGPAVAGRGFLRWVFVVPPLAESYVSGDAATQAAVSAVWTAQHQFGGALLGEHLGQLLAVAWSITVSVVILRSRVLPRWLGAAGLVVSALYLTNQGDILATAVPGFPVWDLGGLIGSTGWGLWVAALGVALLVRPIRPASPARKDVPLVSVPAPRPPASTGIRS